MTVRHGYMRMWNTRQYRITAKRGVRSAHNMSKKTEELMQHM